MSSQSSVGLCDCPSTLTIHKLLWEWRDWFIGIGIAVGLLVVIVVLVLVVAFVIPILVILYRRPDCAVAKPARKKRRRPSTRPSMRQSTRPSTSHLAYTFKKLFKCQHPRMTTTSPSSNCSCPCQITIYDVIYDGRYYLVGLAVAFGIVLLLLLIAFAIPILVVLYGNAGLYCEKDEEKKDKGKPAVISPKKVTGVLQYILFGMIN